MSFIETLKTRGKPLTNILKKEYVIDDFDRDRFSVPLNYLDSSKNDISSLIPNTKELDEAGLKFYKKCMEVHGRVNKANAEYNKLNAAVLNLKKCIASMDDIKSDTEKAWESLVKVEEKLKEKEN